MNESLAKLVGIESRQAIVAVRTVANVEISQEISTLLAVSEGLELSGKNGGEGGAIASNLSEGKSITPNPFSPLGGRIDYPENFFGQELILRNIFEGLNSGSSVALIGNRETGKSSLLKAIQRGAREALNEVREPIYIDLKQVEDESDFYFLLCFTTTDSSCKNLLMNHGNLSTLICKAPFKCMFLPE